MVAEHLREEIALQGRNEITRQGEGLDGKPVSSGVYFYRLEAAGSVQTKRMTLLK